MVTSAVEKESREGLMSAGWEVVALNRGLRKASLRRSVSKDKHNILFLPHTL